MKTVSIGKEIRKGGFKAGFDSLPHKMRKDAKEEIMKLCYWHTWTFEAALRGNRVFRLFEINEIDKFFSGHKLNAWTGEQI